MQIVIYFKLIHRYGFQIGWRTNTVFILNLAFNELLYCTLNLPSYASTYLKRGWPFGYNLCGMSLAFIQVNAYADWISLGLIALSRCMCLIKQTAWSRFCNNRNILFVFFSVWIYALLLALPAILSVR